MADDRSMLGRALTVVEFCLTQRDPVSLAALSDGTGLPKPTVWRIAEDLTRRGLLWRQPDGYSGGPRLAELGDRAADQRVLRSVITPELVELHARTKSAVWVVDVRSETEWTLVDSIYDRYAAASSYAESWPTRRGILPFLLLPSAYLLLRIGPGKPRPSSERGCLA